MASSSHRLAGLGALLSLLIGAGSAEAAALSATDTVNCGNGGCVCTAVDATNDDPGDGSRVALFKCDTSSNVPGAPSAGFAKLFCETSDDELYFRDNGSGKSRLYREGGSDVAVADGGTGLSSYAAGDIPYASASTTISKLGAGADTQVVGYSSSTPTKVTPATAASDTTCDATGTFTDGATVITLSDYDNTNRKTVITATISFSAVSTARTFTIQAKLEGSQVGTDVTCAAASGSKTSCTISILDSTSSANRTFTVTASQSAGTTNTVDTCNVTRLSVLG